MSVPTAKSPEDNALGGMIVIGGDMTVGRLGFGAMRLCGSGF